MTYRTDDERALLLAFIEWLVKQGWMKTDDPRTQRRLVDQFEKAREIQ